MTRMVFDPHEALRAILEGVAPDGMVVDGSLHISSKTFEAPARFPDRMVCRNDFRISSSSLRVPLGKDMTVCGSVELIAVDGLESLPEGLVCGQDLTISRCEHIRNVPAGTCVLRSLSAQRCPELEVFETEWAGAGVRVAEAPRLNRLSARMATGFVDLENCYALERLWPSLRSSTRLRLSAMSSLGACDDGVIVGEDMPVYNRRPYNFAADSGGHQTNPGQAIVLGEATVNSDEFKSDLKAWSVKAERAQEAILIGELPADATVDGTLEITHKDLSHGLPEGLTVFGDLILRHCEKIEELPRGLRVTGNIVVNGCPSLRCTHAPLQAGGNITFVNCPSLETVYAAEGLGHIEFHDCTSLSRLPDPLRAIGSLHITRCASLRALPNEVSSGNSITIGPGCASLQSLGSRLFASEAIDIFGCPSLESFPDTLVSGKSITVSHCPALTGCAESRIHANRRLVFESCESLDALPMHMNADSIVLAGLPVESYAGQNAVCDDLYVTGCERLREIDEGGAVLDAMHVFGCERLRTIAPRPRLLKANRSGHSALTPGISRLGISDCPRLKALGGSGDCSHPLLRLGDLYLFANRHAYKTSLMDPTQAREFLGEAKNIEHDRRDKMIRAIDREEKKASKGLTAPPGP